MFGIGMLLHWPVPLYHCSLTVSGRTPDRDERERTETWNQVGSFLLKSRSFELIRSQTTHHWWQLRKLCDIIAARHSVVQCANKFCRCQKYLAGTVLDFFFIPLSHRSEDSVDQSLNGVCSSTFFLVHHQFPI